MRLGRWSMWEVAVALTGSTRGATRDKDARRAYGAGIDLESLGLVSLDTLMAAPAVPYERRRNRPADPAAPIQRRRAGDWQRPATTTKQAERRLA